MNIETLSEDQRRALEKAVTLARARGQSFQNFATACNLGDEVVAVMEEFSKELEKRDDVIESIGKSLGLKEFGWKRLIAKEWLWFICTVGAAFIAGVIVYSVTTGFGRDDNAIIAFFVPIGLIYISRLTLWAIRQTTRKLPEF